MMMFDGLAKMSKQFLPSICPSSKVVSSSLMKLSLIFKNPRTILFINLGPMGEKRCTTSTTRLSLTIMDYSSMQVWDIQGYSMMSPSYVNMLYTKTNISSLYIQMSILNTCWVIHVIQGRKSSLCVNLGGVNLRLGMIKMLLMFSTKCMQITKSRWNGGLGG